jgi:hypothetical protein
MRGRWVIVGLVLFVAADVVLVAMAFRHVQAPSPPATTAASGAPAPGPTPSRSSGSPSPASPSSGSPSSGIPSPGSSAPAAATADQPAPGSAPVAFLSLGADGAVLRASRGECPGSQRPTVTLAASFEGDPTSVRVPGLREVLAARAVSRREVTIAGLNRRCRLGLYVSTDEGRSWSRRAGDDGLWHVTADPTEPSVVTANTALPTPCAPRSLSPIDGATARVLCDSGEILGTQDAGATWVTLGRRPGAVAVAYTSPADGVALVRRPRCSAAVMRTSDGGAGWTRLVCLTGRRPRTLAAQGDVIAAQVGEHLHTSTDGGRTWRDLHWGE